MEYLNCLVKIPNLHELYDARKLLMVYDSVPRMERSSMVEESGLVRKSSDNSLIESNRLSRMSQLIDNLNFDSAAL